MDFPIVNEIKVVSIPKEIRKDTYVLQPPKKKPPRPQRVPFPTSKQKNKT